MSEASSPLKEDARSRRQQEERPGPHDEDAAAEGEDFLVQPARPGLLPALEVRLEALAGRDRGEPTPAAVEGVEHGPGLHGMGERIIRQPRGAFPVLVQSRAGFGNVRGEPTGAGRSPARFANSPAPRPGTGTPGG